MTSKRAFDTLEASDYVALSVSYLQKARLKNAARSYDAPKHTRITDKKIIYLKEDLDEWLDRHKAASNGAA